MSTSGTLGNAAIPGALQGALAYFQDGKLDAADAICQRVLAAVPGQSDALHVLALVAQRRGQLPAAIALLEQALQGGENASMHCNLGIFQQSVGQTDAAIACYRRALNLTPAYADAWNNLGAAMLARREAVQAIECYAQLTQLQPGNASAHKNLGSAWHMRGDLDIAIGHYRAALALQPTFAGAHEQLAYACKASGEFDTAFRHFGHAQELDPEGRSGGASALQLAVFHYIANHIAETDLRMHQARGLLSDKRPESAALRIYLTFLQDLRAWWTRLPEPHAPDAGNAVLHAIGESHVLSAHNATVTWRGQPYRCHAHWVEGCKQWHLGDTAPNHYQQQFLRILDGLPPRAPVLVTVGEIDCRIDEGILPAWKKANQQRSLAEMVEATTAPYLRFLAKAAARREQTLIVAGVPAFHMNTARHPAIDLGRFTVLVELFNASLRNGAAAAGMDFLDVHPLTNRGDGFSNGLWHIDEHHLTPAGVSAAFARCLRPAS